MITDGAYTAVVDRFEGDSAVVLLEADDATVGEFVLDRSDLPEGARHVDAVLTADVEDGDVVDLTYEAAVTSERAERAQRRFDSLSRRPPSSDDDSASDSG